MVSGLLSESSSSLAARARAGQIGPSAEDRILAPLAATCNVSAPLAEAGFSKSAGYSHRRRWPAFARRWDEAIELGAVRIEFALLGYAGNPFARADLPDPAPMPERTPDDMLNSLYMHKRLLAGSGGRPGRAPRPPSIEEVTAKIVRGCEAIERGRRLGAEAVACEREEWRKRRGG